MERRANRTVRFTFEVSVPASHLPTQLWVARPLNDAHQRETGAVLPDLPFEEGVDGASGNRTLRFTLPASTSEQKVSVSFDIERTLRTRPLPEATGFQRPPSDDPAMAAHLNANRSVPLDGVIGENARALGTRGEPPLILARRAFDLLLKTVTYDSGGCTPERIDEIGNLEVACDLKTGTCTEFHGLLVGYLRALGVPARFTFGFNVPPGKQSGVIRGYHCWADVLLPDGSWFAVDVSEAWKRQQSAPEETREAEKSFYFGSLDADRVAFTRDRDVWLAPKQQGPPIDKFIFPYAEAGGEEVKLELSFRFSEPAPS